MPYQVILADSSPTVQKVIQMAFPEPDFEVHAFDDGLETIESLARVRPDVVLLSLALPSRDGYEVGRYLRSREEFHKVGLILLKNAFEAVDEERLRGIECDRIVAKPFDSEGLAVLIREIVDHRRTPPSFPEEALIEETSPGGILPLFKEEEYLPALTFAQSEDEIEARVRILLRDEALSMEREIEKRLKASLQAEFKEWLDREKKE
jgi:DNA-binding response OmpR family regulator